MDDLKKIDDLAIMDGAEILKVLGVIKLISKGYKDNLLDDEIILNVLKNELKLKKGNELKIIVECIKAAVYLATSIKECGEMYVMRFRLLINWCYGELLKIIGYETDLDNNLLQYYVSRIFSSALLNQNIMAIYNQHKSENEKFMSDIGATNDIKDYIDTIEKGDIPKKYISIKHQHLFNSIVMVNLLNGGYGMWSIVSTDWIKNLFSFNIFPLMNIVNLKNQRKLRILDLGSGKIPWLSKCIRDNYIDYVEVKCIDNLLDVVNLYDNIKSKMHKFPIVEKMDMLDACIKYKRVTDLLIISWPRDISKVIPALYEYSLSTISKKDTNIFLENNIRPILYIGERNDTPNISDTTKEFYEYFKIISENYMYKNMFPVDDTALVGVFIPKCQLKSCENKHGSNIKLRKCSGCLRMWYCSAECQRLDWNSHKKQCNINK